MLKVTKLIHTYPSWERPMCSDAINQYGFKIACDFKAGYNVNGKELCDRHAGRLILKELCKEQNDE